MANKIRVLKTGKAKDYERNAQYFTYYYIVIDYQDVLLRMGGWNHGEVVQKDKNGKYIIHRGERYYIKQAV